MIFETMPEFDAFQRWQDGEFLEVERRSAAIWRKALSGLDLQLIYDHYRPRAGQRLRDLPAAKVEADRLLRRDGWRYRTLRFALETHTVP
jgi:hypothetical protein